VPDWLDETFVVIDFETSGLVPGEGGEVVEVGAVRATAAALGEEFRRFCRPLLPIPPGATNLHGITNEMVAGHPHFVHVVPELVAFVGSAILVAHNAPFDRRVLDAAVVKTGAPPLRNPFLDTVRLSRRLSPDAPAHDLATLCRYHRIRHPRPHRALDDAVATACLLRLLLAGAADSGVRTTVELLGIGAPADRRERVAAPEPGPSPDEQALLEAALARGDRVEIRTRSERGIERSRLVVPYVVDRARGLPRLVAYDVERGETKVFRLDRVVAVAAADGGRA